ncbi:hypothetical protein BKA56DRAFT_224585 [Ilyonectria sp. MPI-CAGE-AT-0026]|nr:hypothetical protein BKA56DRAFT_224585 [Ilyonectria sp. MPI-CAGE-AT-0026]
MLYWSASLMTDNAAAGSSVSDLRGPKDFAGLAYSTGSFRYWLDPTLWTWLPCGLLLRPRCSMTTRCPKLQYTHMAANQRRPSPEQNMTSHTRRSRWLKQLRFRKFRQFRQQHSCYPQCCTGWAAWSWPSLRSLCEEFLSHTTDRNQTSQTLSCARPLGSSATGTRARAFDLAAILRPGPVH